jgi:tetratricopeptide (TPR) repeat protein
MINSHSETDLTKIDVLKYLLEEYFKDGFLEDTEKENIKLIRDALNISHRDYMKIFLEVNDKYKTGKLLNDGTDVAGSNLKVYEKILSKALNDGAVKKEEEDIYRTVAKVLMISSKDHELFFNKVLEEKDLKGIVSLNNKSRLGPEKINPHNINRSSIITINEKNISLEGWIDLGALDVVGCNIPLNLKEIKAYRERNELIIVYHIDEKDEFTDTAQKILDYIDNCFCYVFKYSQWFYLGFGNIEKGITYGEIKAPAQKLDLLKSIDPDTYQVRFEWTDKHNEECSVTFYHKSRIDLTGELFMGIKCCANNEYQRGLLHLKKALKADFMVPYINYYIALCNKNMQNPQELEEHLLEEIQIHPHFHEAYVELGRLYQKRMQNKKAVTYFEKSLEYKTFMPATLYELGKIYLNSDALSDKKAFNIIGIMLYLFPDNPGTFDLITDYCSITGMRLEDTLSILTKEFNPLREKIERLYRASVLMSYGHYGLSARILENCLSLEGLSPSQASIMQSLIKKDGPRPFLKTSILKLPENSLLNLLLHRALPLKQKRTTR